MLYKNIFDMVGNTPLLEIPESVHGHTGIKIYAKLEYLNPFGSVKDRTAFGLIRNNLGEITKNKQTIIESSSGNTAKALVSFAGVLGVNFETISNRIKVEEQKEILELLGAKVQQMPGKSECPDPNNPLDPLKIIQDKITQEPENYYYTDQYVNEENINIHYETTGPEIQNDIGQVDYFFGGLGTTGSTRGTAKFLQEYNANLKSIGIVSAPDDYIPGIRTSEEMWEVGLYEKDFYAGIEEVHSLESLDSMKELIQKCGIHCGPTTGATYKGILQYIQTHKNAMKEGTKIVFIACDSFAPYLSYIKQRKHHFFCKKEKDYCVFHTDKKAEAQVDLIFPDKVDASFTIIDTRNNISFKNIHIPNSINIEENLLYEIVDDEKFPFAKDLKLLFVCPIGKKSRKISAFLNGKGYTTFVLKGGIEDWIDLDMETKSL